MGSWVSEALLKTTFYNQCNIEKLHWDLWDLWDNTINSVDEVLYNWNLVDIRLVELLDRDLINIEILPSLRWKWIRWWSKIWGIDLETDINWK